MGRRKTIQVLPDDARLLDIIYVKHGVPSDQFAKRPRFLERFTEEWNALTGRKDEPGELLRYIFSRRKNKYHRDGKLPCLGRDAHKLDWQSGHGLDEADVAELEKIYGDIGVASDNLAFISGLAAELQKRFAAKTGKLVPAHTLVAVLFARRKRGLLVKTGKKGAFADMDEVAS